MTFEDRFSQNGDGPKQPVDLPEIHIAGTPQPVILVADDEPLIRNLVTLLLQQEGYVVLSAADGHEGLELSRQYPGSIELVITDMKMPRLNGADLAAHLLAERPGIKVLIMSGDDISEIVNQNVHLPFLPKPFDGQTLRARVRAILTAEITSILHPRPAAPARPAKAPARPEPEPKGNAAAASA